MMGKRWMQILLISLYLLIIGYVVSNVLAYEVVSNLVSPPIAFISAAIIYLSITKKSFFSASLKLLAWMSLTWGVADLIWFFLEHKAQVDPSDSVMLMYLYLVPNVMILMSALKYLTSNLKKWHTFQLTVDILITFLLIAISLRYSLFDVYEFGNFNFHENLNSIAYVITDVFALTLVVVMIISARVSKISFPMKWIIMGYFVYIFTDFFYVFASVFEKYQPNAIIDSFYMISFVMFATGAAAEWFKPSLIINPDTYKAPQNTGGNKRILIFALIPVWMFGWGILKLEALFTIAFFLSAYYFVSRHIQLAIINESHLITEKRINEKLEELVERRTADLKKSYATLEKQAITDALGGLFNRKYFIDKVDTLIERDNTFFSMYYLDLNHFKIINDIHGHEMGDAVLKAVSQRFLKWHDEKLIVARIGGDEFAVLHVHDPLNDRELNLQICRKIHQLFADKIIMGDYVFDVDASIGVARYPYDGTDREVLIKYAELAMYQAKKSTQKDRYAFYSKSIAEANTRKNKIELLFKTISFDDEFSLHYQPQFSMIDEKLIGVEALIRWNNPELGHISPGEFIPIAEDTGHINRIGKWVIRTAFKQIAIWHQTGDHQLKMAINLSPHHFDSVNFFPYLSDAFKQYNVLPQWIDFEITENSAMSTATAMEEIFTTLAGMGVSISVDDFGTGYSSLSYIKRFDIDQLKIAKELIDNIVEDEADLVIIKAIILMSKGMGLVTIAEGVETKAQYDVLKTLGCDAIQGYYLSRPLPVDVFEATYLKMITNNK